MNFEYFNIPWNSNIYYFPWRNFDFSSQDLYLSRRPIPNQTLRINVTFG